MKIKIMGITALRSMTLAILLLSCTSTNPVLERPAPEFDRPAPIDRALVSNNIGYGYYGMMSSKWNCDESLKILSGVTRPRISVLWNTFGNNFSCLDRYLFDPRPKDIEVHLINETCIHPPANRCGPYEVIHGETAKTYEQKILKHDGPLFKRLRSYFQNASRYLKPRLGSSSCYVSPGLESNLHADAAKIIIGEVRSAFPYCKVVWSPIGGGPKRPPGSDFDEGHGDRPGVHPPCITNLDGSDIHSANLKTFMAGSLSCEAAYLWMGKFNGRDHEPTWVDPRNRTNWPKASDFVYLKSVIDNLSLVTAPAPQWTSDDEKAKGSCKSFLPSKDGAGGFLLKESDTHPGAVVLLPYPLRPHKVYIMKANKIVTNLTYAPGKGFPEPSNNTHMRQIWRSGVHLLDIPYNVVLHADGKCFVINNPHGRVD